MANFSSVFSMTDETSPHTTPYKMSQSSSIASGTSKGNAGPRKKSLFLARDSDQESANNVVLEDGNRETQTLSRDYRPTCMPFRAARFQGERTSHQSVLQDDLQQLLVQPKYVRVVKRTHKAPRGFRRLFLAQELNVGSREPLWNLEFSPDGKYLAAGGQDGIIRVWKVISSPLDRLDTEHGDAETMSLGGHSLLSESDESDGGQKTTYAPVFLSHPIREYKAHKRGILGLSWSKNNFIVSFSMDATAKLWHLERPQCLQSFPHDDFVTTAVFHPHDDRFLLTGSLDRTVKLWSVLDNQVAFQRTLPVLVTASCFSPDGEAVFVGSFNGWVFSLETRGLDIRYSFQIKPNQRTTASSSGQKVTGISVFSQNSQTMILVSTNDSKVRLYKDENRELQVKYKGYENRSSQIKASLSDDNGYIVTGSENHWVYIWKLLDDDAMAAMSGEAEVTSEKPKHFFGKLSSGLNGLLKEEVYRYKNSNCALFHAHHSKCNVATFAPVATSKLIELSNDPLFELYNNFESYIPDSQSSSHSSSPAGERLETSIIVTTDEYGVIRVFRQDFVHDLRKKVAAAMNSSDSMRTLFSRMRSGTTSPRGRSRAVSFADNVLPTISSIKRNGSTKSMPTRSVSLNSTPVVPKNFVCPTCGGSDFVAKQNTNGDKVSVLCTNCSTVM